MSKAAVLRSLKQVFFWKGVSIVSLSVVDLVWRLTAGLKPTLMYFMFVRRGSTPSLRAKGLRILKNDPEFTDFAQWLRARIPEELISTQLDELSQRPSPLNSMIDISTHLDEQTRVGLVKFALDDRNIARVCGYLRFVPRLATVKVILNRPTGAGAVGPQRWHRDWFSFKGMNIFTALTRVDERTGIYSAVGLDKIPRYSEIPVNETESSGDAYDKGRVSDASMAHYVDDQSVQYLAGEPGTTALVDSGWVYHKGGHLQEGFRLMLEVSYLAQDKPKSSYPENILKILRLENNAELSTFLNQGVRRYMVSGFTENSRGFAVFHSLVRRLPYYKASRGSGVRANPAVVNGSHE